MAEDSERKAKVRSKSGALWEVMVVMAVVTTMAQLDNSAIEDQLELIGGEQHKLDLIELVLLVWLSL